MDAGSNQAGGGSFTSGAGGGGPSVGAVTAGKLEAGDDDQRGGKLDRAMRALGEDRSVACDLERHADVASGERDLGGGEPAIQLVARFGACVLGEVDGAGALTGECTRGRE